MSTIYIFRHGQTTFNKDKIFTGWTDPPLTALGIEQAEIVADLLKDIKFNVAYQSSLLRSRHTLEIVLKYHPECQKIITDDRIRERNYGDLNTIPHQTIIDKFGQEQFDIWHRSFDTPPPGGESYADLKKLYSKTDLNIAISAHSNSIRLFRKIVENATEKEACSWSIPYDKYFKFQI